jgi:mannose/fructose/N-acetylgalactosamine-specific phosphotransferase system component IID
MYYSGGGRIYSIFLLIFAVVVFVLDVITAAVLGDFHAGKHVSDMTLKNAFNAGVLSASISSVVLVAAIISTIIAFNSAG